MQNKFIPFFIICSFAIFSCIQQRISRPAIRGIVYDSVSMKTIENAKIETWNDTIGKFRAESITNNTGVFYLKKNTYLDRFMFLTEAPQQLYDFKVTQKGYQTKSFTEKSMRGFTDDTTFLKIILSPE